MKKVIIAAVLCGILLITAIGSNLSSGFTDGLIIGLFVVTILAGSSIIIAVTDRRRQAWH